MVNLRKLGRIKTLLFSGLAMLLSGYLSAQTARVQIIHNSAGLEAASVDVWLDNTKLLENFAFRSATPFIDAPAGVPFQVRIKGAGSTDTTNPAFLQTYTLAEGERYALIASGLVTTTGYAANPDGLNIGFDLAVLTPALEAAADAGQTSLAIIHGATDAPTVDVIARGVATLAGNVPFGGIAAYQSVPAQDYTIDINVAGTQTTAASFIAPLSGFADSALVVLASGFLDPTANQGGAAFGLIAVTPKGRVILLPTPPAPVQTARVQIIHNSAGLEAASVDVWLDNNKLLENFAFRSATPFIDAPAGVPFQVRIKGAGSTDTTNPAFLQTYTLAEGERYALIASGLVTTTGYAANPDGLNIGFDLAVLTPALEAAADAGQTSLAIIHGATDAPTVDVIARGVATLAGNVPFGGIAAYQSVPAQDYTIDINVAGTQTTAASFIAPLSGFADSALVVLASGFLDPTANQGGAAFGLIAVTPKGRVILLPTPPAPVQTARVQIIHNSPSLEAQTVDVWLDNTKLLSDFTYRSATPFIDAPAGVPFQVRIKGAGSADTTNPVFLQTYTLDAGERYVLIANGLVSTTGYAANPDGANIAFNLAVLAPALESSALPGQVSVASIQGVTDSPRTDVVARGFGTVSTNVGYGEISAYRTVLPLEYTFDFNLTGTSFTTVSYAADLRAYADSALIILSSGFSNPAINQNGAPIAIFAVTPAGRTVQLTREPTPQATAKVQIIHNSAGVEASSVDIWLNNTKLSAGFQFRQASPFFDVPAGTPFQVRIKGAGSTDTTNPAFLQTYTLAANERYALIASGLVTTTGYAANPDGLNIGFDLAVLTPALNQAADAGQTSLAIVHGATDAPRVDVIARGVATLAGNVGFGGIAPYQSVPAQDYTIDINVAGTSTTAASFIAPLSGFADSAIVVLASGFLDPAANQGGPAFGLIAVLPSGRVILLPTPPAPAQTARVQVIHNSAGLESASVDVWLDNTKLLENFTFRSATPFIDAPAGVPFQVRIKGAGSTDTTNPAFLQTYTLAANERYALIASGLVSTTGYAANPDGLNIGFDLAVLTPALEEAATAGQTSLAIVHGATDAPRVDVIARGVATLAGNVPFGGIAAYQSVPAQDYTIDINVAGTSTTAASFLAPLSGFADSALVVLASGFLDPAANQGRPAFGLIAVTPKGRVILLPTPPAPAQTARVQIIHNSGSAEAALVDVWVDNTKLLENFAYRTATPYVDVPAGVPFQVRVKGAGSTDTTNPAFLQTYNLTANQRYVLVANGLVSTTGYAPNPNGLNIGFTLQAITPAFETPTAPGEFLVSLVHGATDAPRIDAISRGVATLIENFGYGENTPFIPFTPLNVTLDIRVTGTNIIAGSFEAPLANFADSVMVVVATGFLNPAANQGRPGFGLMCVMPSGRTFLLNPAPAQTARVQVIHNSAGLESASVDVWLNNTKLLENFTFRSATPFIDAPANTPFTIRIKGAGSTDTTNPAFRRTYVLDAGNRYVLIATGLVSTTGYAANPNGLNIGFDLAVLTPGLEQAATAGGTSVAIMHGSTDAPRVDVRARNVGVLAGDVPYGAIAPYQTIAADDYTLDITTPGGATTVASFTAPLSAFADSALVVLASGFLDPAANQGRPGFGLIAVTPKGRVILLPVASGLARAAAQNNVRIYPNPARNFVMVENTNINVRQVVIRDLSGRTVLSQNVDGYTTENKLEVSNLPKGTYVLTLETAEGITGNQRLVIE